MTADHTGEKRNDEEEAGLDNTDLTRRARRNQSMVWIAARSSSWI